MATVYFGKINISSNIFKVYNKGEEYKNDLLKEIHNIIAVTKHEMLKEYEFEDPETEEKYTGSITYELNKQYIDEDIIIADFLKGKPVNVRQKNEEGKLKSVSVPNYEPIRFYMDTKREIIAYYTTSRFGYKQFLNDFEYFINESIQKSNSSYFNKLNNDKLQKDVILTLITENTDLSDFYKKLLKRGKIQEIRFDIIPPNASDEYLDNLSLKAKERIELMEKAGITEETNTFKSSAPNGLNLKSKPIKDLFENMNSVNEKIKEISAEYEEKESDEKVKFNFGYVEGTAQNEKGEFISTKDEAIYKRQLNDIDKNVNSFKEHFKTFINQIIKYIL